MQNQSKEKSGFEADVVEEVSCACFRPDIQCSKASKSCGSGELRVWEAHAYQASYFWNLLPSANPHTAALATIYCSNHSFNQGSNFLIIRFLYRACDRPSGRHIYLFTK